MVLGRELEEQGAGFVLEPVHERPNHFLSRVVRVEKQAVGLPAAACHTGDDRQSRPGCSIHAP